MCESWWLHVLCPAAIVNRINYYHSWKNKLSLFYSSHKNITCLLKKYWKFRNHIFCFYSFFTVLVKKHINLISNCLYTICFQDSPSVLLVIQMLTHWNFLGYVQLANSKITVIHLDTLHTNDIKSLFCFVIYLSLYMVEFFKIQKFKIFYIIKLYKIFWSFTFFLYT